MKRKNTSEYQENSIKHKKEDDLTDNLSLEEK
jgi:hypothetical protein